MTPTTADQTYATTVSPREIWTTRPAEIVELARALRNNPDKIYEYVRNNIETSWMYGLQKGALGAIIDRSGTAFDQAQLMVELLKEAGFAVSYKAGTITVSGSDFKAWSGVSKARAVCQLLANGGIPATITGGAGATASDCSTYSATIDVSSVQLGHVWVQATIGSVSYVFDPAFKPHTFKTSVAATATGITAGEVLTTAANGTTSATGPTNVRNVNAENLADKLNAYSSEVLEYIGDKGLGVDDIAGGADIVRDAPPAAGWRRTTLPYTSSAQRTWSGDIPNDYRTRLTITVSKSPGAGFPTDTLVNARELYVDEIYGRKLTYDTNYDKAHQANASTCFIGWLRLTDEAGASAVPGTPPAGEPTGVLARFPTTGCQSGTNGKVGFRAAMVTLAVNHPYGGSSGAASTYMDTSVTKAVTLATPITIVNGWGDVGRGLADKWASREDKELPIVLPPGGTELPNVDYVGSAGDGRREQLAASWLAQAGRAARLHAQIAGAVYQMHHAVGVVAGDTVIQGLVYDPQTPSNDEITTVADNFDRIDVETGFSVTSNTADATARRGAVMAIAAAQATLEGSVAGQIADMPDTASTATRFEWGNRPPTLEDPADGSLPGSSSPTAGARRFYQFTSADGTGSALVTTVENLTKVENGTSLSNPPGSNDPDMIPGNEVSAWEHMLGQAVSDYVTAGFKVTTSEEALLGPGQRVGALQNYTSDQGTQGYTHDRTHQRGPALMAVKYSGPDPVEIAFVVMTGDQRAKGGGSGAQPDHKEVYDPAKAADVLKARFVDQSKALGVDLKTGSLTYTSPASLRIGNGGFPYELSASLIWRGGYTPTERFGPISHVQPQAPWTTNWNNSLTISGSGLEAMGESDARAAAGTIAAFVAAQDLYKGTQTITRDVAGVLVNAWWARGLLGNVVTVNVGADTRQFVKLPVPLPGTNKVWIAPGAGPYAELSQLVQRTIIEEKSCGSHAPVLPLSRGWSTPSTGTTTFKVTGANGDVQSFEAWNNTFRQNTYCARLRGYRLKNWDFPQGVDVDLQYTSVANEVDHLASVTNSLNRKINFADDGLSGFDNGLGSKVTVTTTAATVTTPASATHAGVDNKVTKHEYVSGVGWNGLAWNLLGKVFTADDASIPNVAYTYDALRRVKEVEDGQATHSTRPPYEFFIANGVRGERLNPLDQSYAVEFDPDGRPLLYIDALGRTTRVGSPNSDPQAIDHWLPGHDGRGRVTAYTYPEGDQELVEYDDRNNPTKLTRAAKPGSFELDGTTPLDDIVVGATWNPVYNKPDTITDAKGYTTSFSYYTSGDGKGLLQSATRPSPDGVIGAPVYSFTYNVYGQLMDSTDPTGTVTRNAYLGAASNLSSTTVDPGTGHLALITSYGYTPQGDVSSQDGPLAGNTDTAYFFYDAARRRTTEVSPDPDGGSPLPRAMVKTTYDDVGRPLTVQKGSTTAIDGTGLVVQRTVSTTYNYVGVKATETTTGTDDQAVTTTYLKTQYGYDEADRVTCVKVRMNLPATDLTPACQVGPAGTGVNAFGADRITKTFYDAAGQVETVQKAAGSSDQKRYAVYTYTANGKVETVLDARDNQTKYIYDGFDRLRKMRMPRSTVGNGGSSGSDYEEYGYDARGSRTSLRKRDGQPITFIYDRLGRMERKTLPAAGSSDDVFYEYDQAGRPCQARFGSANAVVLATGGRCPNGTLTGDGVEYAYDLAGRLVMEATGGRKLTFAYDNAGARTQVTWPDAKAAVYDYDVRGRLKSVHEQGVTTGAGVLASFDYDKREDRVDMDRAGGAGMHQDWGFDSIGRLNTWTQGVTGLNQTFAYNPASQVVQRVTSSNLYVWTAPAGRSQSFAFDGLNRNGSVVAVSGGGYDSNGNQTRSLDGTWTWVYDAEDRLVSASKTGATVSLKYDPAGRLANTSSTVGSTTTSTDFLYDRERLVAEYNGSGGATLRRYVHGVGVDEPLVWYEGSAWGSGADRRWLHQDRQGSVIAYSDSVGGITKRYPYGPWGETSDWSGSRFRYTGQIMIPEAQLYHYKARAYDPDGGRFLQTDPIGMQANLNMYLYVEDDPTNDTDPDGMLPKSEAEERQFFEGAQDTAQDCNWVCFVPVGAMAAPPVIMLGADAAAVGLVGRNSTVVLGRNPLYRDVARLNGEHYFYIGKAWNTLAKLGENVPWRVNRAFLDLAIKYNARFRLVSPLETSGKSIYAREIKYLLSRGYKLSKDEQWLTSGRANAAQSTERALSACANAVTATKCGGGAFWGNGGPVR